MGRRWRRPFRRLIRACPQCPPRPAPPAATASSLPPPAAAARRFLPKPAPFAGRWSRVLSPPDKERFASTSRAAHCATSVTVQSAGSAKIPVPYSVHAARNRMRSERKPPPPPFASTLTLKAGAVSAHPWRTTSAAALAPSATPMEARTGFENAAVAAAIAARLRSRMYS